MGKRCLFYFIIGAQLSYCYWASPLRSAPLYLYISLPFSFSLLSFSIFCIYIFFELILLNSAYNITLPCEFEGENCDSATLEPVGTSTYPNEACISAGFLFILKLN